MPEGLMDTTMSPRAPGAARTDRDDGPGASIVRDFGAGALLPFQVRPSMSRFIDPSGRVVIVHARAGRTSIVLGDPIGPPEGHEAALRGFVAESRRAHRTVGVYQASASSRQALLRSGFRRVFLIGQEAIVDLPSFSLAGSRRANLRHTVTRFGRDGGTVQWFPAGLDEPARVRFGPALATIDAAWQATAGPALGFTIGVFDQLDLERIPVAVGLDGSGAPQAFVTFQPTGSDGGFVLDLIRRRPAGVPGAAEACIAAAAAGFRDGGASHLSLGLAPIHGLRTDVGPFEERFIRRAAEAVSRWYDIDGLAFFKAKFDPHWEPRSIAIRRRHDVLAVALALLLLHLSDDGRLRSAARAVVGR